MPSTPQKCIAIFRDTYSDMWASLPPPHSLSMSQPVQSQNR